MTKIVLMRKGSRGLAGTIANAEHHAEHMLPFIDALKDVVANLGFTQWIQGHNVHEFRTLDGRRYTLRAIVGWESNRYCGVRLALRPHRSLEYPLLDITDVKFVPQLIATMQALAQPLQGTTLSNLSAAA